MVTVAPPGKKGKEALKEALKLALELRKKYGISFVREAEDEYEALAAVLEGLKKMLEEKEAAEGKLAEPEEKKYLKKEIVQRTLVFIKPDGVKRGLVGKIIQRFEEAGLKIVGLKMMWMPKEFAQEHYRITDKWVEKIAKKLEKVYKEFGLELPMPPKEAALKVIEDLRAYVTSGPIVAMVLEGPQAIKVVRKLVGDTSPEEAAPGTIRGDFSIDSYTYANLWLRSIRNVIHASDAENAEREVKLFFKDDEIFDYRRADEYIMFEPL